MSFACWIKSLLMFSPVCSLALFLHSPSLLLKLCMNRILVIICSSLIAIGCAQDDGSKRALEDENDSLIVENARLKEINDSLSALLRVKDRSSVMPAPDTAAPAPPPPRPPADSTGPIREGNHALTLQWISWDRPGQATIKAIGNGKYSIRGAQRSRENDDYLKIDGTLTPVNEKELVFEGTVEYKVSHNNGGQPCVKKGPLHFKATGNRKYWRMQEMTNCEGGLLTDYVDIYF